VTEQRIGVTEQMVIHAKQRNKQVAFWSPCNT